MQPASAASSLGTLPISARPSYLTILRSIAAVRLLHLVFWASWNQSKLTAKIVRDQTGVESLVGTSPNPTTVP